MGIEALPDDSISPERVACRERLRLRFRFLEGRSLLESFSPFFNIFPLAIPS
ncbi:uncharacterized protein TrAtP1_011333 [Trichoderma atroviride]|uniref:uncharacterized protein n=1 Tax=Hypocrea atroviridis TaxID=63577 RepID=UPI0033281DEF|nr:hypothetical protein TrAtP1_011333 [Trichoderma atroviride]